MQSFKQSDLKISVVEHLEMVADVIKDKESKEH